jgi:Protein of unknown function (DUF3102)
MPKIRPSRQQAETSEAKPNIRDLKAIARDIRGEEKKTVKSCARIGKLLQEAFDQCEHGEYLNWLADEVEYSDDTALNYRRLHRMLEKPNGSVFETMNITLGALYRIAAFNDDDELQEDIIRRVIANSEHCRVTSDMVGMANQAIKGEKNIDAMYKAWLAEHPDAPLPEHLCELDNPAPGREAWCEEAGRFVDKWLHGIVEPEERPSPDIIEPVRRPTRQIALHVEQQPVEPQRVSLAIEHAPPRERPPLSDAERQRLQGVIDANAAKDAREHILKLQDRAGQAVTDYYNFVERWLPTKPDIDEELRESLVDNAQTLADSLSRLAMQLGKDDDETDAVKSAADRAEAKARQVH